jgi:hypothetical protein
MIIALFVYPYDPLGLARFIADQAIFWAYGIIVYLFFLLLGGWHNALIEKLRRKDYKKFVELGECMKEGVEIQRIVRKYFKNATTEDEIQVPIEKLDTWHENTYQKFKEIDPIGAGIWYTSETETEKYTDKDYGEMSAKYLNIIDSKINKLKRDLNYFKKLIDQQKKR